eukprot:6491702-Amphidinium_carterae.1
MSGSELCLDMAQTMAEDELQTQSWSWYSRVPTKSNPTNGLLKPRTTPKRTSSSHISTVCRVIQVSFLSQLSHS